MVALNIMCRDHTIVTVYPQIIADGVKNKHPFYGLFFRTTWVSQHQRVRTILDFNGARDGG